MILVGAITRLTESGLSMTTWRPMIDMLPPATEAAWQAEFDLYKQTPEYIKINAGMPLDAFKLIYFWEWAHRLLGRLIGLLYAVPLFYFWVRGHIPFGLKRRLLLYIFLGGLQGFFGWYMVKSGLVDEPRVSHYRLALHLGTALLLLALLWDTALTLLFPRTRIKVSARVKNHARVAFWVLGTTILWGAFVAGLDAGLVYNEFPTMGGSLVPPDLFHVTPWWANFIETHTGVQFAHRVLGTATFVTLFSLGLVCYWNGSIVLRRLGMALCGLVTAQFVLGIATLLSVVAIPLAVAHQGGAALNLMALVALWRVIRHE